MKLLLWGRVKDDLGVVTVVAVVEVDAVEAGGGGNVKDDLGEIALLLELECNEKDDLGEEAASETEKDDSEE